jgi:hypothetical protein
MHKGTEKGEEELQFHGCEVEVCSALEFVDDLSPRINIVSVWGVLFLPPSKQGRLPRVKCLLVVQ